MHRLVPGRSCSLPTPPQTSTVLVANESYFRGAPQLAGVEVRYIADNTARELGLQSGELHVINGLPELCRYRRCNRRDR